MFKKFSTKELIFLALLGAILFLIGLFIGVTIYTITGIPGLSYLIYSIFFVAISAVGGLVVRKFWTFTLIATIMGALSIPTTVYGPPGIYKLFPLIAVGILVDIILTLTKYKKSGYYIALTIGSISSFLFFIVAITLIGFPGVERYYSIAWLFSILYAIEAIIGTWLGFLIYNKLKNKRAIKQIQS